MFLVSHKNMKLISWLADYNVIAVLQIIVYLLKMIYDLTINLLYVLIMVKK